MEVSGWLLDKSAAVRAGDGVIGDQLAEFEGHLKICGMGLLEQMYSAKSAQHYDSMLAGLTSTFAVVDPPADIFQRALALQRDLAHFHGMWHRVALPDLLIAETALANGLGIVHVDGDFDRIASVRRLVHRRLG